MLDILPQLLLNSLITGSIYALVASGLTLSYSLFGVLNFAHGHLMMATAYLFLYFFVDAETGLLVATALTVGASSILGALTYLIAIAPFQRATPLLTLIATLTLASVTESVIAMLFGVNVRSLPIGEWGNSIEFGGMFITPIQITIIVSAFVLLTILAAGVHYSPLGRRVRALASHPEGAKALGVDGRRLASLCLMLGTALAGVAGVLIGFETNLHPTMGMPYTVKAIAAMVLGGLGNLWGALIGSFILGVTENLVVGLDFGEWSIPAGYKDAVAYGIILVMLLLKPEGLLGSKGRKV